MTKIQDPDLRTLLRELASDPRSRLLHARRAPVELGLGGRVSSRAALLSAAERELLDTYRSEVAELLKDAARTCLFEDPRTQGILHRSITVDRDLKVHSRDSLGQRAGRVADLGGGEGACQTQLELLQACVASTTGGVASAERLAGAAVRLTGDPTAKTLVAIALSFEGREPEAGDAFEMILGDRPGALLRSVVLEFVGHSSWGRGRCLEAVQMYRCAFIAHPSRLAPLLAWFAGAARLSLRPEILESANYLDATADSDHPLLTAFPRIVPDPSPNLVDSRGSLSSLVPGFGPVTSKVAHVLLAP